jgi:uncharacterized membrane protein
MGLLIQTLILFGITLVPGLELRASIPIGILSTTIHIPFVGDISGMGLPWWYVLGVVLVANVLVGVIGYAGLHFVVHKILLPRWKRFADFYHRQVERVQNKIHKDVERWGWLGLAIFIGVPLPGTGVYSGAIAAYALGMGFKRYLLATILGVLMAAGIVLAITMGVHVLTT